MLRLTNASGNLITQGLVTSNPHNPKKGHKFHDFTTFGFRSYGTAGNYPSNDATVVLTVTYSHQPHDAGGITNFTNSLGVYSFALKPEEHQPSGTCNFSRIDSAILEGNYCSIHDADGDNNGDDEPINIYAVNYNVLRIMSGMGGLAYSN